MEGSSKNKSTANFSVGCVKLRHRTKWMELCRWLFYPQVKLKIPLAQSRDEQITSMCHFMPALDIVCLTCTDVWWVRVFISKMWAEMSSELTFDRPCQRSSSLGQCPTYSVTCSSHLENQRNVWEHRHWQIELLTNAPSNLETCPEISQNWF